MTQLVLTSLLNVLSNTKFDIKSVTEGICNHIVILEDASIYGQEQLMRP